jgi:hypothetical protein
MLAKHVKRVFGSGLALVCIGLPACGGTPRPDCAPPAGIGEIGTICGFQGPEDLEYVRKVGLVVVSNMRHGGRLGSGGGFLAAFEPGVEPTVVRLWPTSDPPAADPSPDLGDPACTEPPPATGFAPHGLTSRLVDGHRQLLYVVGHRGSRGSREAVEIFEMRGRGADTVLEWKACVPTPGRIQANDVALTPDGDIVISNYQPSGSMRHMILAALLRRPTGDVRTWNHGDGWQIVPGTEALMANGVAVTRRGENVLFAETMTGKLHRVPIAGGGGGISIEIGGNPDNLTRTPRDTLLLATHTQGAAFMLCMFGRAPCTTSWIVTEIDPDTLATRDVLTHDGAIVGAVATALEVDDLLFLGSVFDDRVGVVRLAPR